MKKKFLSMGLILSMLSMPTGIVFATKPISSPNSYKKIYTDLRIHYLNDIITRGDSIPTTVHDLTYSYDYKITNMKSYTYTNKLFTGATTISYQINNYSQNSYSDDDELVVSLYQGTNEITNHKYKTNNLNSMVNMFPNLDRNKKYYIKFKLWSKKTDTTATLDGKIY